MKISFDSILFAMQLPIMEISEWITNNHNKCVQLLKLYLGKNKHSIFYDRA